MYLKNGRIDVIEKEVDTDYETDVQIIRCGRVLFSVSYSASSLCDPNFLSQFPFKGIPCTLVAYD